MSDFFRFPHTPHVAWLGAGAPRDDKVLAPDEVRALLAADVIVEEKVDGANLGLMVGEDGILRAQNRGSYISAAAPPPQFRTLFRWLAPRAEAISDALFPNLMLFGEWCRAVHSVRYTALPDWFLAFDVYDRERGAFWSVERRNALAAELRIALVPELARGRLDVAGLKRLLGRSRLTEGPAEGLYVRRDDGEWLSARAKLVRASFTQAIGEHWSKRALEENALAER